MSQVTSTEIRSAITAANEKFMTTFGRGDAAGIAALYAENGQLLPPNSDFIAGRQAIQIFWQGAMNMGIKTAKLQTIEVEAYGSTANEVGKFTLSDAAGQVLDTGKYVVIWKHEAGQWKLYRDIWNSSRAVSAK